MIFDLLISSLINLPPISLIYHDLASRHIAKCLSPALGTGLAAQSAPNTALSKSHVLAAIPKKPPSGCAG